MLFHVVTRPHDVVKENYFKGIQSETIQSMSTTQMLNKVSQTMMGLHDELTLEFANCVGLRAQYKE